MPNSALRAKRTRAHSRVGSAANESLAKHSQNGQSVSFKKQMEQRGEPRPLVFTCCLTHTVQVAQLADPALSPGRGRLPDVLFGRLPSLHALRWRSPTFVRTLRRYYATVRLPTGVHVGLQAHGLLQPARTAFATGVDGVSRFSRVEFPCMPGVSDCAESAESLRWRFLRCCLPSRVTASAL